ncbi:hypothetical protein CR513_22837, partial [Mucuna pruriens]
MEECCQHLEVEARVVAWESFKKTCLEKYFLEDVHNYKEIKLLDLKKGNMIAVDYVGKSKELSRYLFRHQNEVEKCSGYVKYGPYQLSSKRKMVCVLPSLAKVILIILRRILTPLVSVGGVFRHLLLYIF